MGCKTISPDRTSRNLVAVSRAPSAWAWTPGPIALSLRRSCLKITPETVAGRRDRSRVDPPFGRPITLSRYKWQSCYLAMIDSHVYEVSG